MMKLRCCLAVLGVCLWISAARAADQYQVSSAAQALPDEVAGDVAKLMEGKAS